MSELISGDEAKLAWAKGEKLEIDTGLGFKDLSDDYYLAVFDRKGNKFRLKPSTIYLNGIEVPAPFEPKSMEDFYVIAGTHSQGWINGNPANPFLSMGNPKWRTEEEIKQVVAALRSIFGKK